MLRRAHRQIGTIYKAKANLASKQLKVVLSDPLHKFPPVSQSSAQIAGHYTAQTLFSNPIVRLFGDGKGPKGSSRILTSRIRKVREEE